MIQRIKKPQEAEKLFENWDETIIRSCLQDVMGGIYANRQTAPDSAAAVLGDFCFSGGEPSQELILYVADTLAPEFIIMVPRDEFWRQSVSEALPARAVPRVRYATKKEDGVFNRPEPETILNSLPAAYTLSPIDEALYEQCKSRPFSRDAQNAASMALAEKLGYHFSHSYPVFEVFRQPTL